MHSAAKLMCSVAKIVSLALALLLIAPDVSAEHVTAEAFVREVLSRNPALQASHLRHDSLRRESTAEGLWPDPRAVVMVDRVPSMDMAEPSMVRYQLEQMVMWPGKLGLMREGSEWRAKEAGAAAAVRRLDLMLEAKQGWLMLSLNAERRRINRASYDLLTTIARTAGARYAGGTGGHHDLVRAEVERNSVEIEKVKLDGERRSIVAMLNALRNAPVDESFADPEPFGGVPDVLPQGELMAMALSERPELKQMDAMKREMQTMADLARRERYPDVMVGAWYNQMFGMADSAGGMIGVALPVVGVTRHGRRGDAFAVRANSIAKDAEAMRAMIRFQVADAVRRLQTADRTLEFLQSVAMPKARENIEVSLSAFSTGIVDMVSVLDARRAVQVAQLSIAETRVEREMARADLERAVGREVTRR